MTESTSTSEAGAGGDQPIALRRLRIESEFREVTRGLERLERDKYGSMMWNLMRLEFAPKVKIMDLVGPGLDSEISPRDEGSLKSVVDFYHGRPSRGELIGVLKFFSVYLMQRARRETSFERQLYLLFKAIDLLRSIVHFSTWSVHRDAEAMVYAIMDDLDRQKPGRFTRYAESEHRIYIMMKKLHEVPQEFSVRLELGGEYIRQTSFFDAFVQFSFLSRFYPRFFKARSLDTRLSVAYARIGALFQDIIDHLGKGYRDARKVNAFIERYNREYGSRKLSLIPVQNTSRRAISRSAQSFRAAVEPWYRRALELKLIRPIQRTTCAMNLARNLLQDNRYREAYGLLNDNYRYWSGTGDDVEMLEVKVDYLEAMVSAAVKLRRRDQAAWASGEQREARARLDEILKERSDYQSRRDAIRREARAGLDDDEEEEVI